MKIIFSKHVILWYFKCDRMIMWDFLRDQVLLWHFNGMWSLACTHRLKRLFLLSAYWVLVLFCQTEVPWPKYEESVYRRCRTFGVQSVATHFLMQHWYLGSGSEFVTLNTDDKFIYLTQIKRRDVTKIQTIAFVTWTGWIPFACLNCKQTRSYCICPV